jgi:hypothetical protein
MSDVYEATERAGNMRLHPYDFFDHLQPISSGLAIKLLDHLAEHPHRPIMRALLWILKRRPNSRLLGRMQSIAERSTDDALRSDGLAVLARIQTPDALEAIDTLIAGGLEDPLGARLIAIGTNRSERRRDLVVSATRESLDERLAAYWAIGELARGGDATLRGMLHDAAQSADDGLIRALGWLGLAKAHVDLSRGDFEDAMDAAVTHAEALVLGIAAAFWGHLPVLERALHVSQLNSTPVWRLDGHLFSDLLAALDTGGGEPGRILKQLLRCGDIS